MGAQVFDVGFISDPQEGAIAAETSRLVDCDLIVVILTTYLASPMVLPIPHKLNTPILVIDLQPTEKIEPSRFSCRRFVGGVTG